MIELNSQQRKKLSYLATDLKPVVMIGSDGLKDGIIKKVTEQLNAHELIKIKFIDFKDEKKDITAQICSSCDASLVRIIGNIAILYKVSDDEDKRKNLL